MADNKQIEKYQALKKQAISVKEKLDTATGKEEQILSDLLKIAEVDSVEEAEEVLNKLDKEIDKIEKEIDQLHGKIRNDYPQLENM